MHNFPVQGDLPHACEGWTIAQRFLRSSTTALVQVDLPSFTVVQNALPPTSICRFYNPLGIFSTNGRKSFCAYFHLRMINGLGLQQSAVLAQGFSKSAWLTLLSVR